MLLEMVLTAQYRISTWNKSDLELKRNISKTTTDIRHNWDAYSVEMSVGYWRNAYSIHHWFVQNVQDNKNDCKRYSVDHFKLFELHSLVSEILDNPSMENFNKLSPIRAEYDTTYFQDLEHTYHILNPMVQNPLFIYNYDFYYKSSW